jgi:hypothetical protein
MKPRIYPILLAIPLLGVACTPTSVPGASDPPGQEIHITPATSPTGVTVELPEISYRERCLVLSVSVSGAHLASIPESNEGPPLPIVAATIFQNGTELELEAKAGGGGGGGGGDGSFQMEQQTIYNLGSPLSANTALPLIVELTMADYLGFDSPLRFSVQAEPDPSIDCGP